MEIKITFELTLLSNTWRLSHIYSMQHYTSGNIKGVPTLVPIGLDFCLSLYSMISGRKRQTLGHQCTPMTSTAWLADDGDVCSKEQISYENISIL